MAVDIYIMQIVFVQFQLYSKYHAHINNWLYKVLGCPVILKFERTGTQ